MGVSVGTLTDVPAFVASLRSTRRAVQTQASTGFVQRRQVQSAVNSNSGKAEYRRWRLEWHHATYLVHNRILALWNDSLGGALEITWTPVDEGSSLLCRFVSQPMMVRRTAVGYSISVELEESF